MIFGPKKGGWVIFCESIDIPQQCTKWRFKGVFGGGGGKDQ